ncbi:MAG: hypothetical protein DRJ31_06960 [Candidatus Methanomethylicota archaeon]|uniref:NADH:quinone oxidoreductase/Mrp antiporter transmembrane domain-containing protein n=1 Tax=Thermoproteota archaeon TaxID=2056631 RepID=A0A497END2_9CREN|nr:MAG: hypothetical protein DRJ31_06960 [Candidatus Verstraetearchaeota archaeon]
MIDPAYLVIALVVAAFISLLSRVNRRIGDIIGTISVLFVLCSVIANMISPFTGRSLLDEIGFHFVVNGYTSFLAFVVALIGLMVILFSISYIEKNVSRYYFFTLITIAGLMGMSYSWNLIWLYILAEICTICSAPLIAHYMDSKSIEGAIKYLIIQIFATAFILAGIGIIYLQISHSGYSGISSLDIDFLASSRAISGTLGELGIILIFIGFAAKFPLFPIHIWLPDASTVAPATISSLLHTMMIKIAGIPAFFILFELTYVFRNPVLLWLIFCVLGVITMFVCVTLAFAQKDLKRLLAYHSVSQVGYVVVGLGIGGLGMAYFYQTGDYLWLGVASGGMVAGLFHLINHTIFKSLLFFGAGAIEYKTHTKDISKMDSLLRAMPLTGIAMLVGSLSIAGVPLFNGFNSKWMIYNSCIAAGMPIVAAIAVLACALTLASFLKLICSAFLGGSKQEKIGDPPIPMQIPLIILSILCIIFGLSPQIAVKYLLYPATLALIPKAVLPKIDPYSSLLRMFGGVWDVYWMVTLIVIGLFIGYLIYRASPKISVTITDEKLAPFTGGALKQPYLRIEETNVHPFAFEYPFRSFLDILKRVHTGVVNLYVSWIAAFVIFLIVAVLAGWI